MDKGPCDHISPLAIRILQGPSASLSALTQSSARALVAALFCENHSSTSSPPRSLPWLGLIPTLPSQWSEPIPFSLSHNCNSWEPKRRGQGRVETDRLASGCPSPPKEIPMVSSIQPTNATREGDNIATSPNSSGEPRQLKF